ncbi:MAG: hypothetical protein GY835_25675 [bacterium]|nr:hypothetical protein [bacterium]
MHRIGVGGILVTGFNWKRDWKIPALFIAVFIACYHLPVGQARFDNALTESLLLLKSYAREHVVLCLIPALFIAGAIAVFVSQTAVMRYLGPRANKAVAYGVASVSGGILAVCSCTILPLFAGIYRMGAGLGPAATFLYAGPAINIMAIILTARVLGPELGVARAVGAVVFSIVIGLGMHLIFRKQELEKAAQAQVEVRDDAARPLPQTALYFMTMIAILIFANWNSGTAESGIAVAVFNVKWIITGAASAALGLMLVLWFGLGWRRLAIVALPTLALGLLVPSQPMVPFAAAILLLSAVCSGHKGEPGAWFESSWTFARQILPLLLFGVLIAGALLGRPGEEGLIPSTWISRCVGGNSLGANLFAAIAGAFMYFATLTEVPILQGLIGSGMGKGPALALLLAGPALSLPNMLVIRSVIGTGKTVVFILLVVIMATLSGLIYGYYF